MSFCPACGVSAELHDGPDTCSTAAAKVDLLNQFFAPFNPVTAAAYAPDPGDGR